jgi:hypothetical protein
MTKMVKVLVLVSIITVMLPISPAQACACVPDWSRMSAEQIASFVNGVEDGPRIRSAQQGLLPPAPPGYRYAKDYKLISLQPSFREDGREAATGENPRTGAPRPGEANLGRLGAV